MNEEEIQSVKDHLDDKLKDLYEEVEKKVKAAYQMGAIAARNQQQKEFGDFFFTVIDNLRAYNQEYPEGFSLNGEGHLLQEDTADHIFDTFQKVINTLIEDMKSECKGKDLGFTPGDIQNSFDRER